MKIPILHGVTEVDECDAHILNQHSFYVSDQGYAISRVRGRLERLHRLVVGAKPSEHVDHANGDKLDNRRANLRLVRRNENMWNSRKKNLGGTKETSSAFKGVNLDRRCRDKKWNAELWKEGKKVFCKAFYSEKEAAIAYNIAARHHFGDFALLNDVDASEQETEGVRKIVFAPRRQKLSQFKGVTRSGNRWIARAGSGGSIRLGSFLSETEAHQAVQRHQNINHQQEGIAINE